MPGPASFCSEHLTGVPYLKDGRLACDECEPRPFCPKHPTAGTWVSHGRKLCRQCDPFVPTPADAVSDGVIAFAKELQEIAKPLIDSPDGGMVFLPGGPLSILAAFGVQVQRLREVACDFSPGAEGIEGIWGRSAVYRVLALPGFWALEKRESRDGAWGDENPTYTTYWMAGASFEPGAVVWAEGPTAEAASNALLLKAPPQEGQPS